MPQLKKQNYYCACCRSPRQLRYARYLSIVNYAQILVLTMALTLILFPWIAWKALSVLPLIWIIFESTHKSLYRKDVICPYCGFDPKWYKKDVTFARKKVEEFLKKNPETPVLKKAQAVENFYFKQN